MSKFGRSTELGVGFQLEKLDEKLEEECEKKGTKG